MQRAAVATGLFWPVAAVGPAQHGLRVAAAGILSPSLTTRASPLDSPFFLAWEGVKRRVVSVRVCILAFLSCAPRAASRWQRDGVDSLNAGSCGLLQKGLLGLGGARALMCLRA